jgi:hypothetical protein
MSAAGRKKGRSDRGREANAILARPKPAPKGPLNRRLSKFERVLLSLAHVVGRGTITGLRIEINAKDQAAATVLWRPGPRERRELQQKKAVPMPLDDYQRGFIWILEHAAKGMIHSINIDAYDDGARRASIFFDLPTGGIAAHPQPSTQGVLTLNTKRINGKKTSKKHFN